MDNSWDASGVNGLRWLTLSSSMKCEGGVEDLRRVNKAMTRTRASRTPNTIPAMAAPLRPDFSSPFDKGL